MPNFRIAWSRRFIRIVSGVAIALSANCALAQSNIIPDTTLGAENSQVNPNFNGQPIEVITGGAIRGQNLFHSFQEFNVSVGREAYFFSPSTDIQNILARVTGSNRSEILGTLGTFGNSNSNLFLINPNGIIFGEDASLDVSGSFVATTANGVRFGNLGIFSATNPETPSSLLTVNPGALFFNQINKTASIQNNSIADAGKDPAGIDTIGLRVPDGKSLLLVGGNVSMDGGELNAYGGRIELGGLAAPGDVALLLDDNNFSLSFPENVLRADVSLTNGVGIYVEAAGGGSIAINARNLEILSGSELSAGIGRGLGTPDTVAGDITLNATGEIKVVGVGSDVFNNVRSQAQGKGGNLTITTQDLLIRDGAQVGANISGLGKGGNLTVNTSNKVELIGTSADGRVPSALGTFAQPRSTGDAGDLTITTQDLLIRDGAQVGTGTFGTGKGGSLTVNASNKVELIGTSANGRVVSALGAAAQPRSTGNAGDLTITTQDLLVRDGAQVGTGTFGTGKGGNLTVNASGKVELIGGSANGPSGLFASAETGSTGDAGNLTVNTQNLLMRDGAQVNVSTFGVGKGGNLTVNASSKVELIGTTADGLFATGLVASTQTRSSGDAGDLTITTQDLLMQDGAAVFTGTFGAGQGGNLTVNASNKVELIGTSADGDSPSGLAASAETDSIGDAGNLTVNTSNLLMRNGAQLSTGTSGAGKGGNLTVNASNKVELIGTSADGRPSALAASTRQGSTGNAGDLAISTQDLLVRDGATVFTGTRGVGKGGNLTVNASNQVELIGWSANGRFVSGLGASAELGSTGNAGDLTVSTQNLLVRDGAQILTATFGQGNAGGITINVRDTLNANNGTISTTANRSSGGAINITAKNIRLYGDSDITSSVFSGIGGGGDIIVTANSIIAFDDSDILAFALDGRGGNITLYTPAFFGSGYQAARRFTNLQTLDGNNRVDVNATGAIASGNIFIPDTSFIQNSLSEFSQNPIDTNALIANSCIARTGKLEGTFTITGSGGLPHRPGVASVSSYPTGDVRNVQGRECIAFLANRRSNCRTIWCVSTDFGATCLKSGVSLTKKSDPYEDAYN